MKICYFNMDFPPALGGMAAVSRDLAKWSSASAEVEKAAVVSFDNLQPRHVSEGKLEIFALADKSLPAIFFLTLKYLYRFRDFGVIHATNLFPVGFFALLLGKYCFGRKVIVSVYGTDALAVGSWAITKLAKKWTLRHCDRVIVVSESTKQQLSRIFGLPDGKMAVVYAGLGENVTSATPKNIRTQYGLKETDFVVISVGRLIERKGADDLIRAIKEIPDESVKLLIVGTGPERENLMKLAVELGVAKRVIFTGLVESVADYYYSADVFSMPSKYLESAGDIEGLGIVYLEAQYFGLPVIGTRSGGIAEALKEGSTGYLVAEGDVRGLADKIVYLKNNSEVYQSFSRSAKIFVQEKFAWENIIKKIIEIYQA